MKNAALAVVAICGFGALAGAQQAAAPVPTLALVNARVYTLEPSRPWAEAVAVAGSRIAAVGTTTDIRALTTSSTRVIDLAGAFVVPGFNDAHVHIDSTGALLLGVNLLDVHEPDRFTARMGETAGRLPKGSWITRGDIATPISHPAVSSGSSSRPSAPGFRRTSMPSATRATASSWTSTRSSSPNTA
jgi:Amidohydrolase family